MANRRDFLKTSAGAVMAAAASRPLFGFQGANNRIRMGVIGMGTRAARVFDSLTRHEDCQFTVGCEVVQAKLQSFQHPEANGRPPRAFAASLPIVGDYRRVRSWGRRPAGRSSGSRVRTTGFGWASSAWGRARRGCSIR